MGARLRGLERPAQLAQATVLHSRPQRHARVLGAGAMSRVSSEARRQDDSQGFELR